MDNVYESIITGLTEAIEDAKDQKKKLYRRTYTFKWAIWRTVKGSRMGESRTS